MQGECWEWPRSKTTHGYGNLQIDGRTQYGHRIVYEALRGEIPEGLELDHLCRNPGCVNPWHLEPVTHRENLLRAPSNIAAINAAKSHCVNGHAFTPENTYRRKDRDTRECRRCRSDQAAKAHRKAGRRP